MAAATLTALVSAIILPERAPRRGSAAASTVDDATTAPVVSQAPPILQVPVIRDADALFATVVSRCEKVFEDDFDAFMEVPDLLRAVFDADFYQHVHLRAEAR